MKSPAGLLVATVLAALCIAVSCAKAVDRALIMPNPSGTPAPESVHESVKAEIARLQDALNIKPNASTTTKSKITIDRSE